MTASAVVEEPAKKSKTNEYLSVLDLTTSLINSMFLGLSKGISYCLAIWETSKSVQFDVLNEVFEGAT